MARVAIETRESGRVTGYLVTGFLAGVIAAVANLVVYFAGRGLGVPFEIVMQPGTALTALPVGGIVMMSAIPAIGAAALAWLLQRYVPRGRALFLTIAVIFLILSLYPISAMPAEVTTGTRAGLGLMHVVAGWVITFMLARKTL